MTAVDTNILIYAHREDSPFHEQADLVIERLFTGFGTWAIPWPCVHEFVAIATHPRVYDPPSTMDDALQQVDSWLESPTLRLIGEHGARSWSTVRALLEVGKPSARACTTRASPRSARNTAPTRSTRPIATSRDSLLSRHTILCRNSHFGAEVRGSRSRPGDIHHGMMLRTRSRNTASPSKPMAWSRSATWPNAAPMSRLWWASLPMLTARPPSSR